MLGDGPEAGPEARPLALTELLMPIGGSAFSAPSDAKFACLDRNHEEKIPHRVGLYQVRERSLAIPLRAGHRVSEEAQRCLDPGQAAIGPARPAGLDPSEAAAMVTRNFVAVHWLYPGLDVTPLHGAIGHLLSFYHVVAPSSQSLMQRRIAATLVRCSGVITALSVSQFSALSDS